MRTQTALPITRRLEEDLERLSPGKHDRLLVAIALFKFVKVVLLVAVGLGALEWLHPGVTDRVSDAVDVLITKTDRVWLQDWLSHTVDRMAGLSARRVHVLAIVAFAYATLFLVEGTGLWLERRWAEYLTAIATSSLIPFEIYEITRRLSAPRIAALVLNLLMVAYLIYRLRHPRR
jgi:uncharacterized membrane protein (DUF2068 family)